MSACGDRMQHAQHIRCRCKRHRVGDAREHIFGRGRPVASTSAAWNTFFLGRNLKKKKKKKKMVRYEKKKKKEKKSGRGRASDSDSDTRWGPL